MRSETTKRKTTKQTQTKRKKEQRPHAPTRGTSLTSDTFSLSLSRSRFLSLSLSLPFFSISLSKILRLVFRVEIIDVFCQYALFDPATDAVLAPLLSDAARRGVQKALLDQVMEKEVHSFAGIIGQKQLFPMCSVVPASVNAGTLSGRALSLIMNTQTTYPSFGYELAHGATTLWSVFIWGCGW